MILFSFGYNNYKIFSEHMSKPQESMKAEEKEYWLLYSSLQWHELKSPRCVSYTRALFHQVSVHNTTVTDKVS